MSLTFAQMQAVLLEIRPLLENATLDLATAASDRKILLHFKEGPSLLLCFQEPFLRFHLTRHHWKDHPQHFSKQLTQALHRACLTHCELLQGDRILQLVFKKGDEVKRLICEFIPKKPNCYLINDEQQILASLNPTQNKLYAPPTYSVPPHTVKEILSSSAMEEVYLSLEQESDFIEKKQRAEALLKKQHKQVLRSKEKLTEDLKIALSWEKLQHETTLLQSNLFKIKKGMEFVNVNDWLQNNDEVQLKLDPTLLPAEEIAKRFQKSKKLKRAIEPLKRQLEQTQRKEEKLLVLLEQLTKIEVDNELKNFIQKNYLSSSQNFSKKPTKSLPNLPYREFVTVSGLHIWVGKSAKDNDKLTFSCANGSDFWLHAHDVPGSHVILHLGSRQEPDEEALKDAIQAALFFSKAKDHQEGEVCITQCKFVTRFGKNQPGKVQISKHRVVYAKFDAERLKNLRDRKNLTTA